MPTIGVDLNHWPVISVCLTMARKTEPYTDLSLGQQEPCSELIKVKRVLYTPCPP